MISLFKKINIPFYQAIKTSFWKKTAVYTAVACITLGTATAVQAQKTDFSGEWKLNEAKSNLGQYTRMVARKMTVNSQKDSLSILRFITSQDGNETTYNEKLAFDGKETESTVFGNSKKKSTLKWSDDGQSLTVNSNIVFERDGQSFEVKVVEVWKLTEGGKVLSLESTSTSQMGTNTISLLFDKAG